MDRLAVVVNVIFTKKLMQTSTYMPASSLYRVLSHYRYPPYSIQTYMHLLRYRYHRAGPSPKSRTRIRRNISNCYRTML